MGNISSFLWAVSVAFSLATPVMWAEWERDKYLHLDIPSTKDIAEQRENRASAIWCILDTDDSNWNNRFVSYTDSQSLTGIVADRTFLYIRPEGDTHAFNVPTDERVLSEIQRNQLASLRKNCEKQHNTESAQKLYDVIMNFEEKLPTIESSDFDYKMRTWKYEDTTVNVTKYGDKYSLDIVKNVVIDGNNYSIRMIDENMDGIPNQIEIWKDGIIETSLWSQNKSYIAIFQRWIDEVLEEIWKNGATE